MRLEIEIRIRIRFIFQREMPPFRSQRLEPVAKHRLAQEHAVLELDLIDLSIFRLQVPFVLACIFAGLSITTPIGMALDTKVVKNTAHIDIFASVHIKQSQSERRAAAMPGLGIDVTISEQPRLIHLRIK